MCKRCHEESDDDYEGSSIEEKRRKATRAIVARHPELGLNPEDVLFRFVPKAEEECVRVNLQANAPTYEIHVPTSMAQAMSRSPSLRGIAFAAFVASDLTYEEVCEILEVRPVTKHEAFFLSDTPPLKRARAEDSRDVINLEDAITDSYQETGE